ncbi:MAG TPA: hypothetical protein PKO09_09415 [Anaerolineae bacterium]|nr:hypothetical protein [Anaerolineae bacterium]
MSLSVAAQGSGKITGVVTNGTAGGSGVGSGLTVTLRTLGGEAGLEPLATITGTDGRFSFEALDTNPSIEYWPEVGYQGVSYGVAQGLAFRDGTTELPVSLAVYEATEQDGSLRVESVHIVAESFEKVLRLSEVLVLANSGDRTFVGRAHDEVDTRLATVFIPLPTNAVGMALPENEPAGRFVQVEDGLWDTQPVRPGANASVVRFSYHLLVEGSSVLLERQFPYPVSSFTVLAVQPGLAVRADQLTAGETVTFQDREYQVYTAEGLPADVPLGLELVQGGVSGTFAMPPDGTTAARPAGTGQQGILRWLGIGLVVIAMGLAVAYPFLTRTRSEA